MTLTTPATDVGGLVAKLRSTFDSGRTRPVSWRRDQLHQISKLLTEREEELLEALRLDLGKPAIEGWAADVALAAGDAAEAAKHVEQWMKPERVSVPLAQLPSKAHIHKDPLGVVLIIGPWNYPVQLVMMPLIGAIAAGNCAVIKPSEVAAHTSAALARLIPQYLDNDAVIVLEGGVAETQALLAERFDHIFYTGNGTVGRVVMEAAAKHLTPVTLELGGKSPVIVDRDANLKVAAKRITWGKFMNAGQTCIAPDYVLVANELEDQLIDGIRSAVHDFYGDDPKASPDYARIINERHFARLTALLDDGVPIVGGETDEPTRYIAPTVLEDVAPDANAMQEEIFGPILPILTVPDVDAAIDFVNQRDKPLALYVFSENEKTQRQVVEETTSGGACVNATMFQVTVPGLPFGGVGPSGMGAYHGRSSFDTFTHHKSVVSRSTKLDPPVAYPPYTTLKKKLLRRFL